MYHTDDMLLSESGYLMSSVFKQQNMGSLWLLLLFFFLSVFIYQNLLNRTHATAIYFVHLCPYPGRFGHTNVISVRHTIVHTEAAFQQYTHTHTQSIALYKSLQKLHGMVST